MNRLKLFWMKFLLVTLVHLVAGRSWAQLANVSDSTYATRDSVLIPIRNGIPITAIIVRKQNESSQPAVLFYTTYQHHSGDVLLAKRLAERGYTGIIAYARGIKTDLTHYAPFEHEGTDIYDIIDWIGKQPWCNGRVGMFGGSYTGYAQWATVKNIHPALKTIVPQVAVMPGYDFPMENNVPLPHILSWSNDNIYKRSPLPRSLPFDYFNTGIAYSKLDSLSCSPNPIFQQWLAHPAYDDYWQAMVPSSQDYAKINIPILTTTGYYDGSQIGALQYYKLHYLYNKNADHYLVIGPYDHWGGQRNPVKNLMGYEIDSVAGISMVELAFEWLDHVLKGQPRPALLQDKVNYQVMGSNTWQHAPSLQSINTDTLTFYLMKNILEADKPGKPEFAVQSIDFGDREHQNSYFTPEIIFDSLDTGNGLVFTSRPFEQSLSINGSFTGALYAAFNKKDMDISLALYEQMPNGKYFFLTRYVGRASYAADPSQRMVLYPGKTAHIPVSNTRFVSKKIEKGSRLVALLNINKHPFEIVNYGSGKQVSDETINDAGAPLRIKWFNQSFLKIPVNKTR